jgi:hypothetical protein
MAKKETPKLGRPSKFSQDLADQICDEISTSNKGLSFICKKLNLAPSTVYLWLKENKTFSEQYAHAREAQADFLADEILEIADDIEGDDAAFVGINRIQRAKLQVDSRKWIASKLKPKKYGEKLDLTSGGDKLAPVIIDWNGNYTDPEAKGSA